MCGIAGYLSDRLPPEETLERMVEALVHRGPDAAGFHRGSGYRGGMRRLRINDLLTGDQPLWNADRSVALLYNGEIYNAPALRRELEEKGFRFRTRSDGEVICHLYDLLGEDLFGRLDGMFAVALWDERRRTLVLARDVPGEKPLHYALLPGGGVAFASELKSLLLHPDVDRTLDLQALWDFPTFLWVPEPATAYAGVRALPPGHVLVASAGDVRIRRYAHRFVAGAPIESDAEAVRETRRVVEEAVESRLLSDVPVGAFLSGGLDSATVTALAARRLDRLDTFTIGFENVVDPYHGRADESAAAEAHARRIGARHHAIRATERTFRESLPAFCRAGDQPFGVSSGLGILEVARAAREEGIKVLLSGDGADEVFGGYSWYAHLDVPAARPFLDEPDASFQDTGIPESRRRDLLARYPAPLRAWAWHYYASEADKRALLSPDAFGGVDPSLRHFRAFDPSDEWSPDRYVEQDRRFYFPNEMLRKLDRMAMACSVEGRVPFAAPAVLAHADRLSFRQRIRGGALKWALREAVRDLLPPETVDRPKHGFNVPVDLWLRGPWADLVEEAFSEGSALRRRRLVRPDSLGAARRMVADPVRLHGHTVFCFVMLNMWLDQMA